MYGTTTSNADFASNLTIINRLFSSQLSLLASSRMNAAFKGADFSVNPLCSVHWIGSNFFLILNFSIESIILQTSGSTVIPRHGGCYHCLYAILHFGCYHYLYAILLMKFVHWIHNVF